RGAVPVAEAVIPAGEVVRAEVVARTGEGAGDLKRREAGAGRRQPESGGRRQDEHDAHQNLHHSTPSAPAEGAPPRAGAGARATPPRSGARMPSMMKKVVATAAATPAPTRAILASRSNRWPSAVALLYLAATSAYSRGTPVLSSW